MNVVVNRRGSNFSSRENSSKTFIFAEEMFCLGFYCVCVSVFLSSWVFTFVLTGGYIQIYVFFRHYLVGRNRAT